MICINEGFQTCEEVPGSLSPALHAEIADRLAEAEKEAGHWRSVKATVLEQLK